MEVRVKTDDGEQTLTAQLLIAADGMESRSGQMTYTYHIDSPLPYNCLAILIRVRGWTGLHRPENDLQYRGYQVRMLSFNLFFDDFHLASLYNSIILCSMDCNT